MGNLSFNLFLNQIKDIRVYVPVRIILSRICHRRKKSAIETIVKWNDEGACKITLDDKFLSAKLGRIILAKVYILVGL